MSASLKDLIWFLGSDIKLRTRTVQENQTEKIDGFYFLTKKPFSKSYQWHGTVGLENTYTFLSLIQSTIKQKKKAAIIDIYGGIGRERVVIWKGSLAKAERLIFDMIKKVQQQY